MYIYWAKVKVLIWLVGVSYLIMGKPLLALCQNASITVDTIQLNQTIVEAQTFRAPLQFFTDTSQILRFAQVQSKAFSSQPPSYYTTQATYWVKASFRNNTSETQVGYLHAGNWTIIKYYVNQKFTGKSGRIYPLTERMLPLYQQYFVLKLSPKQSKTIYFQLQESMEFYLPSTLQLTWNNPTYVERQKSNTRFAQGIFLGVIIVMALYNLFIFFSVKDVSFLYYVCSIVGVGLYFMFYYGFTLEFIWPHAAVWNVHSYGLIVPLTRITWVLFTKYYLHLNELLPRWNRGLNFLIYIYLIPIVLTIFTLITGQDFSSAIVNWIGTLGVIVLSMMLLMGILALRTGFRPARYFLIANIFFSVGLILFIFRETGFLPDTPITRYGGQLGIILQVVLFSLGLANRLNTAQKALAQQEIEKEVERKQLIEQQKKQLEVTVADRTADLQHRTEELKITIHKLQESEKNLKDLNHIKDKFFSIISHDLRSPFTTLTSFLNILINFADEFSKEEMEELAKRTQQSVKNLSSLLENLLQWAMSQMNQNQYQPHQIMLAKAIQETAHLLVVSAEEKKIDLQWEIAPELSVYTDYHMLSFIIRNLLINAIKYTPAQGKIQITAVHQGHWVNICIQDTGVGIPPEDLPKLFNAQEHFTRKGTQNEKGVGLGLMLCKEFVEKGGGKISVASQVNQGTTFCFTIPAQAPSS